MEEKEDTFAMCGTDVRDFPAWDVGRKKERKKRVILYWREENFSSALTPTQTFFNKKVINSLA